MSKAFFTSKENAATYLLSDKRLCQKLVMESMSSWVDELSLNPNWQFDKSLFEYKKSDI